MTSQKSYPNPAVPVGSSAETGYDAGFGHKAAHQTSELQVAALDLDFLLRHGAALKLTVPSDQLQRLNAEQGEFVDPSNPLEAELSLALRLQIDASGARSRYLSLRAQATLNVPCGRCLKAVEAPVLFSGEFLLVESEDLAESLDTLDDPQDVIAAAQFLRTDRLAEDELLMAMAPTYWHSNCLAAETSAPERRNPFGALANLKTSSSD